MGLIRPFACYWLLISVNKMMQEESLSPWPVERDCPEEIPLSRSHKAYRSLAAFNSVPSAIEQAKPITNTLSKQNSKTAQVVLIKNQLAQSCIALKVHPKKPSVTPSPVISPKSNKKMSIQLKMQVRKLEGDDLNFPLKLPNRRLSCDPLLKPKPIYSKGLGSPVHSPQTLQKSRRKAEPRGKLYSRMIKDEFVLLNQKMSNIFSTRRGQGDIRGNIERLVRDNEQRGKRR